VQDQSVGLSSRQIVPFLEEQAAPVKN